MKKTLITWRHVALACATMFVLGTGTVALRALPFTTESHTQCCFICDPKDQCVEGTCNPDAGCAFPRQCCIFIN
jgi:hypothetical protein